MQQSRFVFALPLLACVIAITTSLLYFQNYLGLAPCPLCVVQRAIFFVLTFIFFVAALHNPKNGMRTIYGFLATVTAITGASVAAWHVYLQNLPPEEVPECGPGLDYMLEVMPLNQVITKIFTGSGECSEVLWSLFGLSIPAWTFLAFCGFIIYGFWIIASRR